MKFGFVITSVVYGIVVMVLVLLEGIKALYNGQSLNDISIPVGNLLFIFVGVWLVVYIILGLFISVSKDDSDKKDGGTTNYQTM